MTEFNSKYVINYKKCTVRFLCKHPLSPLWGVDENLSPGGIKKIIFHFVQSKCSPHSLLSHVLFISWYPCPKTIWNCSKLTLSTKLLSIDCEVTAVDFLNSVSDFSLSPSCSFLPVPHLHNPVALHLYICFKSSLYLSSISVLHSALCENVKMILFCFFGHEMWFPDRDLGWSSIHIFPAFTSLTEKPVALHLRAFFLIREKTYKLSQKCQSWWSWEQSLIHW